MSEQIDIKLVTLEKTTYQGLVGQVTIPTYVGTITVLPGHQPLVGLLVPGTLVIKDGTTTHEFAITTGFFEVVPGSRVRIMADTADHVAELSVEEIARAKARAEAELKADNLNDYEVAHLEDVLSREVSRLRIAEHYRTRR